MFDKGSLARYKTFSKSRFPHGVFCKTASVQKGGGGGLVQRERVQEVFLITCVRWGGLSLNHAYILYHILYNTIVQEHTPTLYSAGTNAVLPRPLEQLSVVCIDNLQGITGNIGYLCLCVKSCSKP